MLTVAETDIFSQQVVRYWNHEEYEAFIRFIARNHEAGSVIPNSGGIRKIRWKAKGHGKRGGVRVIYFNMLEDGKLWLLLIYGKNVSENIPTKVLRNIKEAIES